MTEQIPRGIYPKSALRFNPMSMHHRPSLSAFAGVLHRWIACLALIGCLLGTHAVCNAEVISREYVVKATFLNNLTKFITWPPERSSGPLIIGVLGHNPFGDELDKVVQARSKSTREVQVRHLTSVADAKAVNLLFVPSGEESKVKNELGNLHQASVLTVGETPEFSELGGVITFSKAAENIRFEINREAGAEASLKISPQLLKLALSARQGSR